MATITWKTVEQIAQEKAERPKSEVELLREENAQMNLNIIELYEMILG